MPEAVPDLAVPDLVAPRLRVLFCGINPGTVSGQRRLHFARPGNRFWRVLHLAGFTDRVLTPEEQCVLPSLGIGITNLVGRATTAAKELRRDELREGGRRLAETAVALEPGWVAVLGLQAYRIAFARPAAGVGRQPEMIGAAPLWLLPNPSGLQARYQLPEMARLFGQLHHEAFSEDGGGFTPRARRR